MNKEKPSSNSNAHEGNANGFEDLIDQGLADVDSIGRLRAPTQSKKMMSQYQAEIVRANEEFIRDNAPEAENGSNEVSDDASANEEQKPETWAIASSRLNNRTGKMEYLLSNASTKTEGLSKQMLVAEDEIAQYVTDAELSGAREQNGNPPQGPNLVDPTNKAETGESPADPKGGDFALRPYQRELEPPKPAVEGETSPTDDEPKLSPEDQAELDKYAKAMQLNEEKGHLGKGMAEKAIEKEKQRLLDQVAKKKEVSATQEQQKEGVKDPVAEMQEIITLLNNPDIPEADKAKARKQLKEIADTIDNPTEDPEKKTKSPDTGHPPEYGRVEFWDSWKENLPEDYNDWSDDKKNEYKKKFYQDFVDKQGIFRGENKNNPENSADRLADIQERLEAWLDDDSGAPDTENDPRFQAKWQKLIEGKDNLTDDNKEMLKQQLIRNFRLRQDILNPGEREKSNREVVEDAEEARANFMQVMAEAEKGHLARITPDGRLSFLLNKLGKPGRWLAGKLSAPTKKELRAGNAYQEALAKVDALRHSFLGHEADNGNMTKREIREDRAKWFADIYEQDINEKRRIQEEKGAKGPVSKLWRRLGYGGAAVAGGALAVAVGPFGLLAGPAGVAMIRGYANKRNALTKDKQGNSEAAKVAKKHIDRYNEFVKADLEEGEDTLSAQDLIGQHYWNAALEKNKNVDRMFWPALGVGGVAAAAWGMNELLNQGPEIKVDPPETPDNNPPNPPKTPRDDELNPPVPPVEQPPTPEVPIEGMEFNVERGNGYTHEIQEFAEANGLDITREEAFRIHQAAVEEFGPDYIDINGPGGDIYYEPGDPHPRLAEPGSATWSSEEVAEFLLEQAKGV